MQDSKFLCLVFCGHCVREVRCVRAMLAFTYCMYAGACKRTRVRAYVCQRRAQRHVGTRCLCPRSPDSDRFPIQLCGPVADIDVIGALQNLSSEQLERVMAAYRKHQGIV